MSDACGFEGCADAARTRGLCSAHYQQQRHGVTLRPVKQWTKRGEPCVVCGEPGGKVTRFRKFCTSSCENKYRRYDGNVPRSGICTVCGDTIIFGPRPGLRSVPVGTRKCPGKHRRQQSYELTVKQLAERDGTDCRLCHDPVDMTLRWPDRWAPTRDHILPVARGGGNEAANLQLAHFTCNVRKGARVDGVYSAK